MRIESTIAVLIALLTLGGTASAQSTLQVDPAEEVVVVQTDVGDERWSIVYDRERKTIIGNVFHDDGRAPSFLYCTTEEETDDTITFACAGADACTSDECPGVREDGGDDWEPLTTVVLPRSFLEPRSDSGQSVFCGDGAVTADCSFDRDSQSACEAEGGCWEFSLSGQGFCNCPTLDAGTACASASDCEGVCLGPRDLSCDSVTSGQCSDHRSISGCSCVALLEEGEFAGLCVD